MNPVLRLRLLVGVPPFWRRIHHQQRPKQQVIPHAPELEGTASGRKGASCDWDLPDLLGGGGHGNHGQALRGIRTVREPERTQGLVVALYHECAELT